MSNLPAHQQLADITEREQRLAIEKSLALQKALTSTDVDEIWKAQQFLNKNGSSFFQQQGFIHRGGPDNGHRSLIFDPFETNTSQGYFRRNVNVSYELLRAMANNPIIAAVILTRKDQVAEYCAPQVDKYSKGFVIRKKGSDLKTQPNDKEKREIDKLTEFLINMSEEEEIFDMDDFDSFIRKIVDDSLTLDQACFEIVNNNLREPVQIQPVDAATIQIADSFDNVNNIKPGEKKDGFYPSYVQLYQNQIVNEYYPWEMCFGVRNPQTDLKSNGYGKSELERLIATVTAMFNADSYNSKFFQNGTAPKGALLVKNTGGVNKDKIAELRRDWNSSMVGANNFHKTPVLDAEKIEWLDLQKTNRDMEFSAYQEYLIKLVCAVYKISPEEVGFPLKGVNSNSGLGSQEGGKQEKEFSLSKGLKPLLKSVQTWINKFIIGPKSQGRYEFIFAGMDNEDSKQEEERLVKAVTAYMTVDEVRAVRDLEPLPDGKGNIILSPIMMQQMQMEQQQKQMEQQQKAQLANRSDNPFEQSSQDEEDANNPFAKALQQWWDDNLIDK